MASDQPFGNTVILPRPGGGAPLPSPATRPAQATAAPVTPRVAQPAARIERQGLNPLEQAAGTLLASIGRLRGMAEHDDAPGLRERFIAEVHDFEGRAQRGGVDTQTVFWARYALCTTIDEVVLATPWGSSSLWARNGLLNTFHHETWGGEKFFSLLSELMKNPAGNLHLLELLYLCLSFGFEGRYAREANGVRQLASLREELYRFIRHQRGEYERELSAHWQGVRIKKNPLVEYVPFWVVGAVAALLLMLLYFVLIQFLNSDSDPVYRDIIALGRTVAPQVPEVEPPAPFEPTLASLLQSDVAAGDLVVIEDRRQAVVRIRGDGLFPSGQEDVIETHVPLLRRVARALGRIDGRILVTGHSDNIPIRSLRYPSNWHLSTARAQSVQVLLAGELGGASRITSEGRGATEPVADNRTRDGRALNRRVEIILYKKPPQRSLRGGAAPLRS